MYHFFFLLFTILWPSKALANEEVPEQFEFVSPMLQEQTVRFSPMVRKPPWLQSSGGQLRGIGFALAGGGLLVQSTILYQGLRIEHEMQNPREHYSREWQFDNRIHAYERLVVAERVMYGMIGIGVAMIGASVIIGPRSAHVNVRF